MHGAHRLVAAAWVWLWLAPVTLAQSSAVGGDISGDGASVGHHNTTVFIDQVINGLDPETKELLRSIAPTLQAQQSILFRIAKELGILDEIRQGQQKLGKDQQKLGQGQQEILRKLEAIVAVQKKGDKRISRALLDIKAEQQRAEDSAPLHWLPWGIAIAGAVAAGVGTGYWFSANAVHSELTDRCGTALTCPTSVSATWSREREATRDNRENVGTVLVVVGAAVAAGGLVWGLFQSTADDTTQPTPAKLSLAPSPGGVTIRVQF